MDDSRTMRDILARSLVELGWQVHAVEGGDACLQALSEGLTPDVVVTDSVMPRMTGPELVRNIRREHAVRVLLVTADSGTDGVRNALEAGADEYLMKPFTQDALASKLALLGLPST